MIKSILFVALLAAACAPVSRYARIAERPLRELQRSCTPFKGTSPDGRMHAVGLTYLVKPSGQIDAVRLLGDAESSLVAVATAWLRACKWAPHEETGGIRTIETFTFDAPEENEEELRAAELGPEEDHAIHRTGECWGPPALPKKDPPIDVALLVHSTGRAELVEPRGAPAWAEPVRAWLASCPFEPPRHQRKAVAVQILRQLNGAGDLASRLERIRTEREQKIARPKFAGSCAPGAAHARPEIPDEARRSSTSGVALIDYVVSGTGYIHDIHLRDTNVPIILYVAAREWLATCRMEPALTWEGKAVPSKIIQPFVFLK